MVIGTSLSVVWAVPLLLISMLIPDAVGGSHASPDVNMLRTTRRKTIIGGQDAHPSRYPYFVRLDYKEEQKDENSEFGCGGTLIHEDIVLTAAHCAYPEDLSILSVVAGPTTTTDGEQRISIQKVIPHIAYDDAKSTSNDIALIQLTEPMPNDYPTIRLNDDRNRYTNGEFVTAIGLGSEIPDDEEDVSDFLQEVQLNIVSDEICEDLYDGDIHRKSMICAKGGRSSSSTLSQGGTTIHKDTCVGDSGGPLLHVADDDSNNSTTNKTDVQVGIVSFGGERCGDPDQPGVYADVAYLKPWIDSMICRYSENPPIDCTVTVETNIEPILISQEDGDVCRDFAGAFFVNRWHQFQRCDWLRQNGRQTQFCYQNHEAWVQCPLTCHSCTYETDDDYYYDDAVDDWMTTPNEYDQSSSPTSTILLLVFSCIFVCQCCGCWIYYYQKQRNIRHHDCMEKDEAESTADAEIGAK